MFDALRRMIFPIIIIVLLFFGGMIVLEWGLGLSGRQQFVDANLAGEINGTQVSWQEYNQIYNNLLQYQQRQSDVDELPESQVREIQRAAWEQLVVDQLMLQKIQENSIVVTDEELYNYLRYSPPAELQALPYFQTNGEFDYQKYVSAMTDPQAAPFWAQIEAAAVNDIAKMKAQELAMQTAVVTEPEVREWYLAGTEKVKVGMINVDFKRFSTPAPIVSAEQVEAYFNENREEYTINARAALNLVMIEKAPSPADVEVAYNKAMAIYDSIQAGSDFAEMARIYSDDPGSKEEGGDLGWFPRGQMVPEFERYAFQMDEGDVSEPVKSDFGWHIIKVHGKRTDMEKQRGSDEEQPVEKIHASHILIEAVASQETLDQAYRRLTDFRADAVSDGFFAAAEEHRFPVRNTDLFFRGGNIQYLGADPKAGIFAFENEVDAISEVYENNSAVYVVQVAEKREAGQATFEEARQRAELDLQRSLIREHCTDTAQAIYNDIMSGMDPKTAAERHGEEYETPEAFGRSGYVPGIRQDPMAIGAAFALKTPGEITKPVDHDQGVVIFELISKESPDMSQYTEARDSVRTVVLNRKRQDLYSAWIQYMVENSDIKNYVQEALDAQRLP